MINGRARGDRYGVDVATANNTLAGVWEKWVSWKGAWGWDDSLIASAMARLGWDPATLSAGRLRTPSSPSTRTATRSAVLCICRATVGCYSASRCSRAVAIRARRCIFQRRGKLLARASTSRTRDASRDIGRRRVERRMHDDAARDPPPPPGGLRCPWTDVCYLRCTAGGAPSISNDPSAAASFFPAGVGMTRFFLASRSARLVSASSRDILSTS